MKIQELIERLEAIKSEKGDIDVVVKYRDEGGLYSGVDRDLMLEVKETNVNELYL